MCFPGAVKQLWPQSPKSIPHFFLRKKTPIFPSRILVHRRGACPSLRLRPLIQWNKAERDQRARGQPIGTPPGRRRHDVTPPLRSLPTAFNRRAQEARGAKRSEVERKGGVARSGAAAVLPGRSFPASARGTRRLEQNEWLVSILVHLFYENTHCVTR